MRYEDLDVPIAGTTLHVRFNPRLTVLAGLDAPRRTRLIELIGGIHAGTVADAHLSVVDMSGRPHIIDAHNRRPGAPRTPGAWTNALRIDAEDLGLPRGPRDPARLATEAELDAALGQTHDLQRQVEQAEATVEQINRLRAELADCEERLANAGSPEDRHQQNRARTLVELERVRSQLAALDAPHTQQERDARLLATTAQTDQLATEWAGIADHLDHLRLELLDQPWMEPDRVERLLGVPATVPDQLAHHVEIHERLLADRSALRARLDQELAAPPPQIPEDPRVLTLATLDQQTLWDAHRAVMQATAAPETPEPAPADRDRTSATTRRWRPGVLIALAALGVAGTVLATTGRNGWPYAAVAVVIALAAGLWAHRPRTDQAAPPANPREGEPDPAAQERWHALVGEVTPAEAATIRAEVTRWAAEKQHPAARRDLTMQLRRAIEQVDAELAAGQPRLAEALAPYGLDADTENLSVRLAEQVRGGGLARLQHELVDTEQAEAKITERLETELHALGFEAGDLSARLAAYEAELDAAERRDQLRRDAPDRSVLQIRKHRLEARLNRTPPPGSAALPGPEDPATVELRRRRDDLQARLAGLSDPDLRGRQRRLHATQDRVQSLREALEAEAGVTVARPVDHLVDTLVRYRSDATDPGAEPLPALLDDPFTATPAPLRQRLLDALLVVSELVQVVVLTNDDAVVRWAETHAGHPHVSLVAPPR